MKSKIVDSKTEIAGIIQKCEACNLAMIDLGGNPYVVPMNFGFEDDVLYLHCSRNGKKMDILRQNKTVCVSFSTDHQLRWQSEKVACSYSMKYRSVLISGKVEFVERFEEKQKALDIIMANYTERKYTYSDPAIKDVVVFKVIADKIEGRVYGY